MIDSVICDTPARAYVKCVKSFSGYHGSDKCTQNGTWIGKMTYPETNAPLRTDASFANRDDGRLLQGCFSVNTDSNRNGISNTFRVYAFSVLRSNETFASFVDERSYCVVDLGQGLLIKFLLLYIT